VLAIYSWNKNNNTFCVKLDSNQEFAHNSSLMFSIFMVLLKQKPIILIIAKLGALCYATNKCQSSQSILCFLRIHYQIFTKKFVCVKSRKFA
jgi:hypothetical protein